MKLSVRFIPTQCPGCGSTVEAGYAQYRHARRHLLFAPLLIVGVVVTLGAVLLSLWGTTVLTTALTEGMQFRRKESGLLYFLAFAATLPGIAWLSRLWWGFIHGLSRKFAYECPTCRWSGAVRVVDRPDLVKAGGEMEIVERVEFKGIPAPFDPIDAKGERQQRRRERERRQARAREQEMPANPDFDFREQ